ncbi:MAG TPA: type II toxin-antitoxin system Phd/YefM family antitoxin [Planctomycetota bacterium]|jgi:antitoxin (DNA-binding transcriptional repressor) of toxin-antitoxin stability system|nr:type II toxin-antitoxin system Phd/YefM family antitoxin [Planctomycetota bacterium]
MKRVKISELRDHLSRYLDHVRAGGTLIVLDRTKPIAEIRPIAAHPPGQPRTDAEWLDSLERRGLIRRGTGRLPAGFLEKRRRRGPVSRGAPLYEAILEEREESR